MGTPGRPSGSIRDLRAVALDYVSRIKLPTPDNDHKYAHVQRFIALVTEDALEEIVIQITSGKLDEEME